MGILIDIIVIALIALSIFLGYRKGFIELSVKLLAFIIALIVTLILYRPISSLIINNTSLDETIQNAIIENVDGNSEEENNASENTNSENQNTENNNTENNVIENFTNEMKAEIMPEVAKDLSINIINAGVIIILYILIRIALKFITALANLVAKLPIIKQVNKLGGIIYGLARGIIIVYVVLLIISFVGTINPQNEMHKQIEGTVLTKAMYEHNIIEIFL